MARTLTEEEWQEWEQFKNAFAVAVCNWLGGTILVLLFLWFVVRIIFPRLP